jgi:hypothetical protein
MLTLADEVSQLLDNTSIEDVAVVLVSNPLQDSENCGNTTRIAFALRGIHKRIAARLNTIIVAIMC